MTSQQTSLILLPGLDGTGLVFEPLLKHLPATIEPVFVRYPGDTPMSFQEHIDFAGARLPDDKPFVLLAESFPVRSLCSYSRSLRKTWSGWYLSQPSNAIRSPSCSTWPVSCPRVRS